MEKEEFKETPLPSLVQIPVEELYEMREQCALLAALKVAKVEEWHGYKYALWLTENDLDIKDIKMGWAADRKNKGRRKQQKESEA
jgi:hypothetical protein